MNVKNEQKMERKKKDREREREREGEAILINKMEVLTNN
jgi:hypothetical protein